MAGLNPVDGDPAQNINPDINQDENDGAPKPKEVMSPRVRPGSASPSSKDDYNSAKSSQGSPEDYKKLQQELQELREMLKQKQNIPSYHSMASSRGEGEAEEEEVGPSPSEIYMGSQVSQSSQVMEAIQTQNVAISKTLDFLKNQEKVKSEKLPTLDISDTELRSINLMTWMKSSGQKIGNMGVMSKKFWKLLENTVLETYEIYTATDHMQRNSVTPKIIDDPEYENIRDVMGSMIHEAVSKEIRNHMVAIGIMEPEASLLHIYKRCAPGGPEERKMLLEKVRTPIKKNGEGKWLYPITYKTAGEVLRKWHLMYERAIKLKVSLPDPSELWLAVWSMVKRVIVLDEVFMLQVTQARITTQIELMPSQEKVLMLYNMILSEFELKVDVKTEADPGPDGAKSPKPKDTPYEPKGKGKGKEKGKDKSKGKGDNESHMTIRNLDVKDMTAHDKKELKRLQITRISLPVKGKGKGKGKGDNTMPTKVSECYNFKTDEGCGYGKTCIFYHPPVSKESGKCSICGSTKHPAAECPRPNQPRKPGPKPEPKPKPQPGPHQTYTAQVEPTKEEKELKELTERLKGDDTQKGKALKMLMEAYKKDDPPTRPAGSMMACPAEVDPEVDEPIKGDHQDEEDSKVPRLSAMKKGKRALLDSGANHAATYNRDLVPVKTVAVTLADGSEVPLGITEGGTIKVPKGNQTILPIIKMGETLKTVFQITKEGSVLWHPTKGYVNVEITNGLPTIDEDIAMEIIYELEKSTINKKRAKLGQEPIVNIAEAREAPATGSNEPPLLDSGASQDALVKEPRSINQKYRFSNTTICSVCGYIDSEVWMEKSYKPHECIYCRKKTMQLKQYIGEEHLNRTITFPEHEVLDENDPLIMKKIPDGPVDIRTTFRDKDAEVIFEMGTLAAHNYQHLPDAMVYKWPQVKYISTSTIDEGFPLRIIELKRTTTATLQEGNIIDEGENNLHSKRKKRDFNGVPRKKATVIRRKKRNEEGQMVQEEELVLPPLPNIQPGTQYMLMPVEEFHELLDENLWQHNILEEAWVNHIVRLPENGLIPPPRARRYQGSYSALLGPNPEFLHPRRKVIVYYMDNTAAAWNEDWNEESMVDINHEGLEGEPYARSVIIKYYFHDDDREEDSEISGIELDDVYQPETENEDDPSNSTRGNPFEPIATDSEDYTGDPGESDASEEVEKSVRDLAMKMVALYVFKDASKHGLPDGFRTLYKLFLAKENPHTLRQCQVAMRAVKSGTIGKKYIASRLVQEVLKLPAFADIPQETLDYMVRDLDDSIPKGLLEPGAHVFLYDGVHDGESTAQELKKMNPDMGDRIYSFDTKNDKGHDIFGPLWSILVHSAIQGRIRSLLGGPNCRSWSILLQRPSDKFPSQRRTRDDPWKAIDPEDQFRLDQESNLLLRMLVIIVICHLLGYPMAHFLEHPEDPEKDFQSKLDILTEEQAKVPCPSIWVTEVMKNVIKMVGGNTQSFDQGALGHKAKKRTTIWTDLPINVDGIRKYKKEKAGELSADELARWAPGLREAINEALVIYDKEQETIIENQNRSRDTELYRRRCINRFRVTSKKPQVFYDHGTRARMAAAPPAICEPGEKLDPLKLSDGEIFWNEHCRGGHLLYNKY